MRNGISRAGVVVALLAAFAVGQATQPAKKRVRIRPVLGGPVVSADSGGTRGGEFPWCDILVPTSAPAVTRLTRPTLCWWLEKPLPYGFQCTLIDTATDDAVTDKPIEVPPVTRGGWQTIDLDKAGVTLQAGHTYQWNFSPAVPAGDATTGGKPAVEPRSTVLKVVAAPADVEKALAAVADEDKLQLLIDDGYWLDAAAVAVRADLAAPGEGTRQAVADLVDAFGRRTLAKRLAGQ